LPGNDSPPTEFPPNCNIFVLSATKAISLKIVYLQDPAIQEAFVGLVSDHRGMLYKVCRLYCFTPPDRQDLFQEIVFQLWRSYPSFRGEARISTWLYRIALNTAISGLRKQRGLITTVDPGRLPAELQDIQYPEEKEQQIQALYAAIEQLTEVERALTMLYLENKSYQEMEEILGISQNNLRVKMNRIRDKLRKITKADTYGIGKS
jgi:RNA polymerase sigma-70 factor, ECF subfamily